MTAEEFKEEFEIELYKIFGQSRKLSPYKTGNLRNNGIQIMDTPTGFRVWVDLSAAPYAQWLDDKPKIQREHPEGWFNEIALTIVQKIVNKYSKFTDSSSFRKVLDNGNSIQYVSNGSSRTNFKEFRSDNY